MCSSAVLLFSLWLPRINGRFRFALFGEGFSRREKVDLAGLVGHETPGPAVFAARLM